MKLKYAWHCDKLLLGPWWIKFEIINMSDTNGDFLYFNDFYNFRRCSNCKIKESSELITEMEFKTSVVHVYF